MPLYQSYTANFATKADLASPALTGTPTAPTATAGTTTTQVATCAFASAADNWTLCGAGQTATGVWSFAVDGAKATVDFTGLAIYNEIMVMGLNLTSSSSGVKGLRVSTNNGSSYWDTSGNYKAIANTGAPTNVDALAYHITGSTAARNLLARFNTKGDAKFCQFNGDVIQCVFDASTSDINAIRIYPTIAGTIGAGTIRVYGR